MSGAGLLMADQLERGGASLQRDNFLHTNFDPRFDTESGANPQCLRSRVFPSSAIGWTSKCVVPVQQNLPDFLFTNLSFVNERGELTRDISYKDGHEQDEDLRYVRVITRNAYYCMLSWTLFKSGIIFMVTEYSNLTFYKETMDNIDHGQYKKHSDEAGDHGQYRQHSDEACVSFSARVYLGIFVVLLFVRIAAALRFAKSEWKRDEITGPDFIRKSWVHSQDDQAQDHVTCQPLNRIERCKAFLALAFLQLLGVRGIIRDLPTYLHPWKGVMPYAAFKADGARAYLLGFPNRELFRLEDEPNFMTIHILAFVQSLLLSSIKVYIRTFRWTNHGFLLDLAPGLFSTIMSGYGAYSLWEKKRKVWAYLSARVEDSSGGESHIAKKLLDKHFGRGQGGLPVFRYDDTKAIRDVEEKCLETCAEYAREMQQLRLCKRLEHELGQLGVNMQEADKFLKSVRTIARRRATEQLRYSAYSRHRGPTEPKQIGYIGSPENLKDKAKSELLHSLVRQIQAMGHQVYVGPPNNALQHDGVQVQDMNEAAVNMFDIVLITPGGGGAKKEAHRLKGHAIFFTFVDSTDERNERYEWMAELDAQKRFDFRSNSVIEEVITAVGMCF